MHFEAAARSFTERAPAPELAWPPQRHPAEGERQKKNRARRRNHLSLGTEQEIRMELMHLAHEGVRSLERPQFGGGILIDGDGTGLGAASAPKPHLVCDVGA